MLADLRFAVRQLRKAPGFTAAALLTLAVGIGSATAIFSIVDAVILRPLPYPDADRIVRLYQTKRDEPRDSHSGPDFLDFRAQGGRIFAAVAAYREASLNLTGTGRAVSLRAVIVTPGFFDVFQVSPLRGRTFHEEDRVRSARPVVLGYAAWQTYFGGRESALGSVVRLNQRPHQIVGVMPPGFPAATAPDLWTVSQKEVPETPFPDRGEDFENNRSVHYLSAVARLRPDVSMGRAQAAVATIAARLSREYPDTNGNRGARLLPMHEDLVGSVRPALLLLFAAVGVVLAVVAVNIASLLLARGAARCKEMAVRAALGAGRGRLLRQVLSESLLLGLAGGLAGLLLASWTLDLLVALGPGEVPRLADARIDARVLAFSVLLSAILALLFGMVPAISTTRADLVSVMRQGVSAGPARQRLRSALVVTQLAASVVLLVSAVLVGRSFVNLQRVDLGFDPDHVLSIAVPLPETEYAEEHRQREFFRVLIPRIAALPGVRAAAAAFPRPFSGAQAGAGFEIQGRGETTGGERNYAALAWVTPDYFRVLGIPLRRGRVFTDRDTDAAPRVIVINRSMADRFWPEEDAIGRKIRFAAERDNPWFEVVGIVGDARTHAVGVPPGPEFFVAHAQTVIPFMTVLVRAQAEPAGLSGAIRSHIAALDPNLPAGELRPLARGIDEQTAPSRFRTILLVFFGSSALLLAALGVYGVVSYSVSQRTAEIGVRVALGASRTQVRRLVLHQGLRLTAVGLVMGLLAAGVASRWLGAVLFDVDPADPAALGVVAAILAAVALIASYLPARRAVRIEPSLALRIE